MTARTAPSRTNATPTLSRLAPVMIVERVEPSIAFWVDRFGFDAENQVPGPDGALVFASAKKGDIEVMYQTRASVVAEAPDRAAELTGHSVGLFINVPDLGAVELAVAGAPVVAARHKTFYGTEEIYVREPGGNIVGFAQRLPEET
ncbi:MAG TPA: VOC family protein [Gemmatimonadaceae bacterium]|nr:VOC family protein [Gemmatimonadaceae bacterium]